MNTTSFKSAVKEVLRHLDPRPVYAIVDATDCDHYRVVSAIKLKNYREFQAWCEMEYNCAEGPVYIHVISKEEYRTFSRYERDYAMEAYENGHPHSIHY